MGALWKVNIDGRIFETVIGVSKRFRYGLNELVKSSYRENYTLWIALRTSQRAIYTLEPVHILNLARQNYHITSTVVFSRTFTGGMYRFTNSILQRVLDAEIIRYNVFERTPVYNKKKLYYQLLVGNAGDPLSVTYGYRVLFDGEDVTAKVISCDVTYSLDNYTGECSITWGDWEMYERLDPLTDMGDLRLEVYTRSSYEDNEWVCQGKFLQEKRSVSIENGIMKPSSWGRTVTAKLGEPYAYTVTKTWDQDTDAATIAAEVLALSNSGVNLIWRVFPYTILGSKFSADAEFPADLIGRLAAPLGAIVTTNKNGDLIVRYQYV